MDDVLKLGVVFPMEDGEEPLVAFPLVLSMGWKNIPPNFSTATETITNIANKRLCSQLYPPEHPLDLLDKSVLSPSPIKEPDRLPCSVVSGSTPTTTCDPSLPHPFSYINVFVDDFTRLPQESSNSRRVRKILLHAIDDVLRPLEPTNHPLWWEPVSLKKLRQGDYSWGTIKLVLGWVINAVAMTI